VLADRVEIGPRRSGTQNDPQIGLDGPKPRAQTWDHSSIRSLFSRAARTGPSPLRGLRAYRTRFGSLYGIGHAAAFTQSFRRCTCIRSHRSFRFDEDSVPKTPGEGCSMRLWRRSRRPSSTEIEISQEERTKRTVALSEQ